MTYKRENAETVALKALAWLAENDELLPNFMATTGLGVDELRSRAQDAELLASVLDFILMDDAWVAGFCEAEGLPYESLMGLRQALPGGEQIHWT